RSDDDECDARGSVDLTNLQLDVGQVDERVQGRLIRTDGADEEHVSAETGSGYGLIRALATGNPFERRGPDCFARARERFDPCREVEIHRADDRKLRLWRPHWFSR